MTLPVPVDSHALWRRLVHEEETTRRRLAQLEDRVRRFADVERPAYEAWLRLEIGPLFADLAERRELLRARELQVDRILELVEVRGLEPHEALYVATEGATGGREDLEAARRAEARRYAKRQRKRAQRKDARRAARVAARPRETAVEESPHRRLLELYRALVRRLHPDSPTAIAFTDPGRGRAVWMEVQAAYGVRNLERLVAISAWLEAAHEAGDEAADDGGPNASAMAASRLRPLLTLAERHERVRFLRRSSRVLEGRLAELARDPAWEFAATTEGARRRMRQAAARRLEGELAEADAALRQLDDIVVGIGSPRAPRAATRRRKR